MIFIPNIKSSMMLIKSTCMVPYFLTLLVLTKMPRPIFEDHTLNYFRQGFRIANTLPYFFEN